MSVDMKGYRPYRRMATTLQDPTAPAQTTRLDHDGV